MVQSMIAMNQDLRGNVPPFITFLPETASTVVWQILEMLRVEKGGEAQLEDEWQTYHPLISFEQSPGQWCINMTVMIEIDDTQQRHSVLMNAKTLPFSCFIIADQKEICLKSTAIFPPQEPVVTKGSAVNFIRFTTSTEVLETIISAPDGDVFFEARLDDGITYQAPWPYSKRQCLMASIRAGISEFLPPLLYDDEHIIEEEFPPFDHKLKEPFAYKAKGDCKTKVGDLRPQGLFFVATPIGNLDDITIRALNLLHLADRVLCEDTRVTQRLLSHYGMNKKLYHFDEHNQRSMIDKVFTWIQQEELVCLVSDAGTPMINDPGLFLAQQCRKHNLSFGAIPGSCSLIHAYVLCGVSPLEMIFGGFIDQANLEGLLDTGYGLSFFVSPHKVVRYLTMLDELAPRRTLSLAREMTKQFEEVLKGTAAQLLDHFMVSPPRGEMVLIIEKGSEDPLEVKDPKGASCFPWEQSLKDFLEKNSLKDSVEMIIHEYKLSGGRSRKIVYQRALAIKKQ